MISDEQVAMLMAVVTVMAIVVTVLVIRDLKHWLFLHYNQCH